MESANSSLHSPEIVKKYINLPNHPMISLTCFGCFQGQMIMQDRLEKERCDAKNAVEEYVYDMRDKLCGPLEDFCKEMVNFDRMLLVLN